MEDITTKKREIEGMLEDERSNLAWLKESLSRSDQLAKGMLGILDSFEDHLCKLEDTILPVHKETMDLQRRQENIEKSLGILDQVISYHNVSNNVRSVIEDGPTGHLDEYLKSLDRVQDAIRFFNDNNPESIELSLLKSLYDTGKDLLEREFRTLLQRHSKPVPAVTIQDILNAMAENDDTSSRSSAGDEGSIEHLPERTMLDLGTIAKWLTQHGQNTDFMSVYSQVRSSTLLLSLQGIKDGGSNLSATNFPAMTSKIRPLSGSGTPKKPTQGIKRGSRRSTAKPEGYIGHWRQSSYPDAFVKEEDENSEVSKFITCTGALLKLIQSEKQLMQSIIPDAHQIPIFSHLLQDALHTYQNDAAGVCNSAKKLFMRLDHSSMLMILPVLKYVRSVYPEFENVLKMVHIETRKKFTTVVTLFEQTGGRALHEFTEKLRETEKHTTMPKDGTVHEVTTNVMVFLEDLVKYVDTTGAILMSKEGASTTLRPPGMESDITRKKVSDYISTTLSFLSRSLTLKAKSYDSIGLQAIFMLNNYNYIVKSLSKSHLMELMKESGYPMLQKEYDETIGDEMNSYEKSWNKVIHHLLEINAPISSEKLIEAQAKGHLKDKHKQAIKDKFKGFNSDFDDLRQLQKSYSVPDAELRANVCESIINLVMPLYTTFLLRYRDIQFTRNPDKYIKYTVDECRNHIMSIFDMGAARTIGF